MMDYNLELVKKYFNKDFIVEVQRLYEECVGKVTFVGAHAGYWKNYHDKNIMYNNRNFKVPEEIMEYYNYIFYPPNIPILDYVIQNKEYFKDKIFFDYGAGAGLLSVFLSKLGIKCYNYDNFSQVNGSICPSIFSEKLNLPIEEIITTHPGVGYNVILSCGIPIDPAFINEEVKVVMEDPLRTPCPSVKTFPQHDQYGSSLIISRR